MASAAPAQNVLQNPHLDSNLDGWTPFGLTGGGSVEWDALDFEGDPASGSMLAVNQQPGPSLCTGMLQYVDGIEGGRNYRFGGHAFILADLPFGEEPAESVHVELQFRAGACPGTFIPPPHFVTGFTPTGQWIQVAEAIVSPQAAECALFAVAACKDMAGGQFSAHWDGLFLGVDVIFADGFESGDTTGWSNAVP